MPWQQSNYDIRCEWGDKGLERLVPISDVVIIVDVLSFSTLVSLAAANDALVYPCRYKDETAAGYAHSLEAALVSRAGAGDGFVLAPAELSALRPGRRVGYPSQNGSGLTILSRHKPTLVGSLVNAAATARVAQQLGRRIAVIPAQEKWPDGSARYALEDHVAAGAFVSCILGKKSPEAVAAELLFKASEPQLKEMLKECISAQELARKNCFEEVVIAGRVNSCDSAALFDGKCYRAVKRTSLCR